MPDIRARITSDTVRDDFNSIEAVLHYTRAAHALGLWESERILIERFFTDQSAPLLEAGCGAGRATLGLWNLGYRNLTAFDFAEELLEQAVSLSRERGAGEIRFILADATHPNLCHLFDDKSPAGAVAPINSSAQKIEGTEPAVCHQLDDKPPGSVAAQNGHIPSGKLGMQPETCHLIDDKLPEAVASLKVGRAKVSGALFLFNGLMQIPGRENRRVAMRQLGRVCNAGAPFLFTTHDREESPAEVERWARERETWNTGKQKAHLVEFGDRYMESAEGRIFMHLPDQAEILEDLAATGWKFEFTAMRREIARESRAVREFSDECRFWVARTR
jgi:SAM-dependent methyltransferase